MAIVRLTIDGTEVEIEQGKTVLEAARRANIYIPALCSHPDLPPASGAKPEKVIYLGDTAYESTDPDAEFEGCGLCVVEVESMTAPQRSCDLVAAEGMVVNTSTPEVQDMRRERLKAILARHPHACITCTQREGCSPFESCPNSVPPLERCCSKLGYCELEPVSHFIGIDPNTPRYLYRDLPVKEDEPLFKQDYNLCIGCTRCVRVCRDVRGIGALGFINRGGEIIAGPIAPTLKESGCKFCGACVEVCPTGALLDKGIKRVDRESQLVPCTTACPAGIDVPAYIGLAAEGRFAEALEVVREKVPFPGVLGRVCFHPCEDACRRGELNEPIAICSIKRAASEKGNGLGPAKRSAGQPTGKKAAVVGSGPAGLTAAYYLSVLGHSVTVFEGLPEPGGMMRVGIPRYRLPSDVLDAEIEAIKEIGVDIRTSSRIESPDELWKQGYDAILLATGAHAGLKMKVEGESGDGLMQAVSLLREVNLGKPPQVGERVTVVGGGNAAIDAARTALRLGAGDVSILYRRSREEMPAAEEEIEGALEEGVRIEYLAAPVGISRNDGGLALQCQRMELGERDSSGRRRPVPIEGSEFDVTCDTIIAAIGQEPEVPDEFELPVLAGGRVKTDADTLATATKGVFAAGDIATGPASVIEAIASGRKAAASIDRYLGGSGDIDMPASVSRETDSYFGRDEDFYDRSRVAMPAMDPGKRASGFDEVYLGYDEDMAHREAARCLKCHVRLQISTPPEPPSDWLEFSEEHVEAAPDADGVFRLFDENKDVIYIGSGTSIREELKSLDPDDEWMQKVRYLHYEETLMYTMRESELIQQFLQEHGRMPEGNEDLF